MATLPPSTDFTGSGVTQGNFKTAISTLRTVIADLLGTDSSNKSAARAVLGAMDAVTPGTSGNVLTSNGSAWVSQAAPSSADQVARDQIALTNMRLMLNSAVTTGALVQGKQWELSTDEWGSSSTNETYTAGTPNYYANPAGYTADQIPTMTANTSPSGTASASSEYNASLAAWKAMNKNTGTSDMWLTASGLGWLAYDWGAPKTITKYTVTAWVSTGSLAQSPKDWTFEGWNGSSWVVLDTQTNHTTWTSLEKRTFPISNSTAYNKYRINVSANNGGSVVNIVELEMMESTAPLNATLIPPAAVSVSTAPTYMDAYFLWKDDSGSAVLGTDLTVELSRDNGTTYTAATLTNLGSFDGSYSVIKARVDVSAQPSGTSMLCRIKTLNNKAQRVAAPALYAE